MTDNPLTDAELARRKKAQKANEARIRRNTDILKRCGFIGDKEAMYFVLDGEKVAWTDPSKHVIESVRDVVAHMYVRGMHESKAEIRKVLGL